MNRNSEGVMVSNVWQVGMADIGVAVAGELLCCLGLGSCVCVVVFDSFQPLAAMAHVMLPGPAPATDGRQGKYADLAVQALVRELRARGCHAGNLTAKVAGGAQMFAEPSVRVQAVGIRNVQAVLAALAAAGIFVAAQDVGGSGGRSVWWNTATRRLTVRTVLRGTYDI